MSDTGPQFTLEQDGVFTRVNMGYTNDALDAMAQHAAERIEDELAQQLLARLGYVRLPQRKVYLVHSESGEYSDWSFVPLAVFTTREKAVEWIEGQRVGLVNCWLSNGEYEVARSWEKPTAYGHPSTTDGTTWAITKGEGDEPVSDYDRMTWFIDDLELDPTKEETE